VSGLKITIYLPVRLEKSTQAGKLALVLAFGYQACAARHCLFPEKIQIEAPGPVAAAGAFARNAPLIGRRSRTSSRE
jgi:hypothetical protein